MKQLLLLLLLPIAVQAKTIVFVHSDYMMNRTPSKDKLPARGIWTSPPLAQDMTLSGVAFVRKRFLFFHRRVKIQVLSAPRQFKAGERITLTLDRKQLGLGQAIEFPESFGFSYSIGVRDIHTVHEGIH